MVVQDMILRGFNSKLAKTAQYYNQSYIYLPFIKTSNVVSDGVLGGKEPR